jgi:hypothetical protein
VGHLRDEDLIDIFESNVKMTTGYAIAKAKGMWKEWLSYINQRIMLPLTKEHIYEEGVFVAMMVWNGLPLNWSKIVYNNIKVELMRKKTRGLLALHTAIYLTKIVDPK